MKLKEKKAIAEERTAKQKIGKKENGGGGIFFCKRIQIFRERLFSIFKNNVDNT